MTKRLKFCISMILVFAIFVSAFTLPAASFESDVETSTSDMMLVNMDTETVVFSKKADTRWYAGTLSELMTFLLAYEAIPNLETVTFKVEKGYISDLPYSDDCLKPFIGKTLTAKDLMAIMLLTSGNDAAYALADLATDGDIEAFVTSMNERAAEIGCTRTGYASPGYNGTSAHHTTCRDLYTLYREVDKIELYHEIMDAHAYTPEGLDEEKFAVTSSASIVNSNSPYYFRYVTDAKFSYTDTTRAGIVLTTNYGGMTYFYAGLLGQNKSEQNVYIDARKLTTWAYLNLSNRKIMDSDVALNDVTVQANWGDYQLTLYTLDTVYKTLPNEFDETKLSYVFDVPDAVPMPLLEGQILGKAEIAYEGEVIDEIEMVVPSDEGLSMLSDFARFGSYVYSRLLPDYAPANETMANTFVTAAETAIEDETTALSAANASETDTKNVTDNSSTVSPTDVTSETENATGVNV